MFHFPSFALYKYSSMHNILGCPIRKFTDQNFLTVPRDLSQSSTSFIASYSLGIHNFEYLLLPPRSALMTVSLWLTPQAAQQSSRPPTHQDTALVLAPSNLFGNLVTLYRLRSNQDTDRITYRCFLPDLTRFMTVCCVASNQNGPRVPSIRSLGGNSAPHKRISGKGHR